MKKFKFKTFAIFFKVSAFWNSWFHFHTFFPISAMIYPRALMMITKIHIWLIGNLYPRFGWIPHETFLEKFTFFELYCFNKIKQNSPAKQLRKSL